MEKRSIVELSLEHLGWGNYQNEVFITTFLGWSTNLIWWGVLTIMLNELTDLLPFQVGMLGTSLGIGNLIGSITGGYLSNSIGSSIVYRTSIYLTSLSGICLIFISDFWLMSVLIFMIGMGTGVDLALSGTIMLENCPPSKQWVVSSLTFSWCLGYGFPFGIALLIPSVNFGGLSLWRSCVAICAVLCFIFGIFRSHICDTPYYFQVKNKKKALFELLEKIAKSNGKEFEHCIPWIEIEEESFIKQPDQSVASSESIFQRPTVFTTVLLSIVYMFSQFGYTGLPLFMPSLLGLNSKEDAYLVILVQNIVSILGVLLATYMVSSCFGRKWTTAIAFLLSGITTYMFLMYESFYIIMIISSIQTSANTMGFSGLNILCPESFPATIRPMGNGFANGMSFFGGVVAPFISVIVEEIAGSECLIMVYAASFMVAGISTLFLRETNPCKTD